MAEKQIEQFRAVDEVDGETVPREGVTLTKTEAQAIAAYRRDQGAANVRLQQRVVTVEVLNDTGWEDIADE
jgi:hypothetical protein